MSDIVICFLSLAFIIGALYLAWFLLSYAVVGIMWLVQLIGFGTLALILGDPDKTESSGKGQERRTIGVVAGLCALIIVSGMLFAIILPAESMKEYSEFEILKSSSSCTYNTQIVAAYEWDGNIVVDASDKSTIDSNGNHLLTATDRYDGWGIWEMKGNGSKGGDGWESIGGRIQYRDEIQRWYSKFSDDAKKFAYMTVAGDVMLRDIASNKSELLLSSNGTPTFDFYDAEHMLFAFSSSDSGVGFGPIEYRLYNISSRTSELLGWFGEKGNQYSSPIVSPDKSSIAIPNKWEGKVWIINAKSWEIQHEIQLSMNWEIPLNGWDYSGPVSDSAMIKLAFSPDSKKLSIASRVEIVVVDVGTGVVEQNEILYVLGNRGLGYSTNGDTIYLSIKGGSITRKMEKTWMDLEGQTKWDSWEYNSHLIFFDAEDISLSVACALPHRYTYGDYSESNHDFILMNSNEEYTSYGSLGIMTLTRQTENQLL